MAVLLFERSFCMHIAFVSLGAFGHINPTLALVTETGEEGVPGDLFHH